MASTHVTPHMPQAMEQSTVADMACKLMNLAMFLVKPRKGFNFRWANSARDFRSFRGEFEGGQYSTIYGRISSRYKYHLLQQYENAIRKFDATEGLAASMRQFGNVAFYQSLPGQQSQYPSNFSVDLTRICEIDSVKSSANYLHKELLVRGNKDAAETARDSYVRGFTRPIRADDFRDWELLRHELRNHQRVGGVQDVWLGDQSCLVAVSYKGKDVKLTRRMMRVNEDGSPDEEEGVLSQIHVNMTGEFFDDFRWSQLVRSCMAIARAEGKTHVRLWIDRLVMMGMTKEERKAIYKVTKWEEFGLLPYAVCHVVRLYDAKEPYYGTDFWRKLETVLGVAGKGLFVDDYMLRKYDHSIFYGPQIYTRMGDGLSCIGGGGVYIRSTTLALATAILTDGVSVKAANEDIRTSKSATGWKSWAIRTIAEGAYSDQHSSIMVEEEPFSVGLQQFLVIAFWESMVARSTHLTGKSYLDMSFQRSIDWTKYSAWDGIVEWIGMMPDSCNIEERDQIARFLDQQSVVSMYASTTGHVASMISLKSNDFGDKRTLVVDLTRFSTARSGQVTAVAEATGIWENTGVIPPYLEFVPDPDEDQLAEIADGQVRIAYKQMKVQVRYKKIIIFAIATLFNIMVAGGFRSLILFVIVEIFLILILLYFLYRDRNWSWPWPWVDKCDVGEAVFDNLLVHALYEAGVKTQYRTLRNAPLSQVGWH